MSKFSPCLLCLLFASWTVIAVVAGADAYLTPEGRLHAPLELRESQSGFAGVTGTRWTIAPDGRWTRAGFINDQVRPPDRQGRLSGQQLAELAGRLAQQGFTALPARLGQPPPINPRTLSIRFGTDETALVLHPDEARNADLTGQAGAFRELFEVLVELLESSAGCRS